MRTLTFKVPGLPIAQPRGRAFRSTKGIRVASAPSDHAIWAWRDRVIYECRKAMKLADIGTMGAVVLYVTFQFRQTGRVTKKMLADTVGHPHTKRPDLDNLLKGLKDALKEAGVLHDDRYVYRIVAEKWELVDVPAETRVSIEEL